MRTGWRAIWGVTELGGFAHNGTMPWPHSVVDMQRFARLTRNGTVIMGRGTWESPMPTPLPHRKNVVLSKTLPRPLDTSYRVCATIDALEREVERDEHVWVIGGIETLWALRQHIVEVHQSTFYTTARAELTLDTNRYLEDYALVDKTYHDDHTYRVYRRIT